MRSRPQLCDAQSGSKGDAATQAETEAALGASSRGAREGSNGLVRSHEEILDHLRDSQSDDDLVEVAASQPAAAAASASQPQTAQQIAAARDMISHQTNGQIIFQNLIRNDIIIAGAA